MEIEEFLADFNSAVIAAAHADETFRVSAFLDVAADRLADAQEVVDMQVAHFEGVGSARRKLRLDGAVIDDADGSLVLLVGEYRPGNDITRLTTTDARQLFAAVEAFVEDAISGRLAQVLEESSEAFRTAMMISRLLPTVSRIRIYLVTNAIMSDRIKDFPPSKFGSIRVTYHIWDLARLLQAQLSTNGREAIVLDLTKWIESGLPALRGGATDEGFQTYLAVLPAHVLASIYLQFGSRLLEGNVRSFLSTRVAVNKGIRATLAQEPTHFLAFNNGLTTTASAIETAEIGDLTRITSITDLQIVNGGQTTASLASFVRDVAGASLEGVFVQMKLVVVEPTEANELAPNIAKYANSQNRISEVDFFSNSAYHRRLEELSRRLLAPAAGGSGPDTRWFYERARGQYLNEKSKGTPAERRKFEAQHPRSQVLIKTDVAKYIMSWAQRPNDVSLGAQKNFLKFADSANTLWESHPDEVNELYFRTLVAKAILFVAVHKRISQAAWYQAGGYLANLTTYTIAKISLMVDEQAKGQTINWQSIWSLQGLSEAMFQMIDAVAIEVNGVLTSPKRGVQNVSEWAKREECWGQVKAVPIELVPSLRVELVSLEAARADLAEARSRQRLDSGIESQMKVLSVDRSVWIEIRDSPESRSMLSPQDRAVLKLVTGEAPGAVPEGFQVQRLLNVLDRAREYGVIPRT